MLGIEIEIDRAKRDLKQIIAEDERHISRRDVSNTTTNRLTEVLQLSTASVLKLVNPEPGNWTVSIISTSAHSFRVKG